MIDYLTFTTDVSAGNPALPNHEIFEPVRKTKTISRLYKKASETKNFGLIQYFEMHGKEYISCTLGGEALENSRQEYGLTDDDIIALYVEFANESEGSNLTRLDYAIDTQKTPEDIRNLWYLYERYGPIGHFAECTLIQSGTKTRNNPHQGLTMYMGSPRSSRRFRVYDKAAQLGILSEAWVRVELQQRKKGAFPLALDMYQYGTEKAAKASMRRSLGKQYKGWLEDVLKDDYVPYRREAMKPDKWQSWITDQVIVSLRSHLDSHYDFISETIGNFSDEITRYTSRYESD